MKKLILAMTIGIFGCLKANDLTKTDKSYEKVAQTGDLIFQTEIGRSQALAIQAATLSPYNHVGVVVKEGDKFYVYEAHGPVKKISLKKYVHRKGTGSRFVVYRHDDINQKHYTKIKRYVKRQVGKPYDSYLRWSNSSIYCSELGYKALGSAGLELNEPNKIKDLKFATSVGKLIPNGYKLNSLKTEDYVVAPSHLTRDANIYKVYQNW